VENWPNNEQRPDIHEAATYLGVLTGRCDKELKWVSCAILFDRALQCNDEMIIRRMRRKLHFHVDCVNGKDSQNHLDENALMQHITSSIGLRCSHRGEVELRPTTLSQNALIWIIKAILYLAYLHSSSEEEEAKQVTRRFLAHEKDNVDDVQYTSNSFRMPSKTHCCQMRVNRNDIRAQPGQSFINNALRNYKYKVAIALLELPAVYGLDPNAACKCFPVDITGPMLGIQTRSVVTKEECFALTIALLERIHTTHVPIIIKGLIIRDEFASIVHQVHWCCLREMEYNFLQACVASDTIVTKLDWRLGIPSKRQFHQEYLLQMGLKLHALERVRCIKEKARELVHLHIQAMDNVSLILDFAFFLRETVM
jgi:hypothetical protein